MQSSKVLGLYDHKTKKLNPTTIKLAFIGTIHEQCRTFQNSCDLSAYLLTAIKQELNSEWGRGEQRQEDEVIIGALLAEFIQAVDDKALFLGLAVYEDYRDSKTGRAIHTDKLFNDFETVISEIAKELCSTSRVVLFRPIYEEGEWLWSERHFFESVVELKVEGFDFIAGLHNLNFYGSYYSVPNQYISHILLSYDEEENGAEDYPNSGYLNHSVNPLIMEALENLARHEIDKCMAHYAYDKITKNPVIVEGANLLSKQLGVDEKGLLINATIAVNINQQDIFEEQRWLLECAVSRDYQHILSENDEKAIVDWLSTLDASVDFQADYSVLPLNMRKRTMLDLKKPVSSS